MSEIVDLHIGKRLRGRRRILGLTQSQVGALCGVRFQQIQKYEAAANHLSAAMLWRLAEGLRVPVQYFYEGLDDADSAAACAARFALPPAHDAVGFSATA